MWVTAAEMQQIADFLGISLERFMRTYIRQKNQRYALVELPKSNYDCVFLKENQCTIYPVRPQQCRTFPWWVQNLKSREAWEAAAMSCEGIRKEARLVPLEEIQKNLESANAP